MINQSSRFNDLGNGPHAVFGRVCSENPHFWMHMLVTALVAISLTIGGYSLAMAHAPVTSVQPILATYQSPLLGPLL